MREFSNNEKRIISNALINGSGLSDMLSDDFKLNSKLHIKYKINGIKRFEFSSEVISSDSALMELIDQINLLQYLLDQGLVTAYPIAATVIRRWELEDQVISLGMADPFMPTEWSTSKEDAYISEFVKRHENSFFKATQPLVSLSQHNWVTPEERRHNQALHQARRANGITVGLAIATSLIGVAAVVVQVIFSKRSAEQNEHLINITEKGNVKDSVMIQLLENKIDFYDELSTKRSDQTNTKIDSLKTEINSVQKETQKIKKKLKMQ